MESINKIYCDQAIFNILSYLGPHQLAKTMLISKQFYYLANLNFQQILTKYFKSFDKIGKYNVIYGQLFQTESLICRFDNHDQFIRKKDYLGQGIKRFEQGNLFTAFHFLNDNLIVLNTSDYEQNIDASLIIQQVQQFSVVGKHLIYLINDQVNILFYEQDKFIIDMKNKIVPFKIKVKKFVERYCYLIAIHEDNSISCYLIYDLSIDNYDNVQRLRTIENQELQNVISFTVGINQAYFLNDKNQLFVADLSQFITENIQYQDCTKKIQIQIMPFFQGKKIIKVFSGLQFYFALELEENQKIEDWNNNQINEWASKVPELEDYLNIIKYQKIQGKHLINADKQFFIDRLGLKTESIIAKISQEIKKYKNISIKKQQLYAWGINKEGQLAIRSNFQPILHPQTIQLPQFSENERIIKISCGWKNSMILTNEGNIWINTLPKPKSDSNIRYNNKTKAQKKIEVLWHDITNKCKIIKNRKYIIQDVFLSKYQICVLGQYQGKINKIQRQSEDNILHQKVKTSSADQIMKKLLWNPHLNQDDFIVGYKDKYGYVQDYSFQEITRDKIIYERISYLKNNNKIVWDKKSQIDLITS